MNADLNKFVNLECRDIQHGSELNIDKTQIFSDSLKSCILHIQGSSLLAALLVPGTHDFSCFKRDFQVFGTCILGQDLDSTASGKGQSYIGSTFLFPEHKN